MGLPGESFSAAAIQDGEYRDSQLYAIARLSPTQDFYTKYFWHNCNSSYEVFVAEYFLRRSHRNTIAKNLGTFFDAFPSIETLANATEEKVLIASRWAGLHYRVRALPSAARKFATRSSWTSSELQSIPHIGKYASEAIALYAFGEAAFPVDGNVRRVVSKFFKVDGPANFVAVTTDLIELSLQLGGVERLKEVHRALLELGTNRSQSGVAKRIV